MARTRNKPATPRGVSDGSLVIFFFFCPFRGAPGKVPTTGHTHILSVVPRSCTGFCKDAAALSWKSSSRSPDWGLSRRRPSIRPSVRPSAVAFSELVTSPEQPESLADTEGEPLYTGRLPYVACITFSFSFLLHLSVGWECNHLSRR